MTKVTKGFAALVAVKLGTMLDGNVYSSAKVQAVAKSIKGRAATLDVDIHAAGVAAIHTSFVHGDTTSAERIVNALGKHTRAKAMVAWFHAYSNVRLAFDKKADAYKAKLCAKDERMDHQASEDAAAKALSRPFWSVDEKDTDPREFKLHSTLVALIKRAEKADGLSVEEKAALVEVKALALRLAPAEA